MKSDSSMGFWSFVLSALILAPGLGVGISHATGFANAASAASAAAQAQAASAPQPAAAAPAAKSDDKTYEVKRGDTLTKVFGKHAGAVCKLNHLRNCDKIEVRDELKLPDGVTPREVRAVKSLKSAKAKVTKRPMPAAKPVQEESCIKLGTAPFNRYGDMKLRLQGIDLSPVLTDAEKDEAKALILAGRGERMLVTSDMVFEAMPFRSKSGQVKFVRNAKVCTPEQGGRPEVLEVWRLSTGKLVTDPISCGNIGTVLMTLRPEPQQPAPQPESPQPKQLEPEQPQPNNDQPRAVIPPVDEDEVVLAKYDWDAGAYIGLDRDVKYAGGEGAFYPVLSHRAWGRYALGIGGLANFWDGSTPSDWDFNGRYGAIGLAQKWSWNERRDLGIKFPMVGTFHERGGRAAFRESRDAKLICASLAYTDASREKAGEKVLPEWQVWLSFCDPTSQSKSRTVFGQPANADGMRDINYILSVGGRVYLTKDLTGVLGEGGVAAKLQPFVELGVNKTSPNPFSAHLYGGLRGVKKISSIGVGPHYSSAGTVIGATYNHDIGRHVKLHNDEERWAAMVKSLEALGVAIDE